MVTYRSTLVLALAMISTPTWAGDWETNGAPEGRGETMVLRLDETRSYIFECTPNAVRVTYTGVTELLNIRGEGNVSDTPGSIMPDGAALMALYTGRGEPQFLPAEYKPNAVKGWDLTLRLSKNDKSLKSLQKASSLSLFTTGYTVANAIDAETRAKFTGFLERCGG